MTTTTTSELQEARAVVPVNERLLDRITAHRVGLVWHENAVVKEIGRHYRHAGRRVAEIVMDAWQDDPRRVNRWALARNVEEQVMGARADAKEITRASLIEQIPVETERVQNILLGSVPAVARRLPEGAPIQAPRFEWANEQINAPGPDGLTFDERFEAMSDRDRIAIRKKIAQSVAEGDDMRKAAKRIRESVEMSHLAAARIARTEIQRVSVAAADRVYAAHSDIVKGVEYVATLDERTCMICGPDDGRTFMGGESRPVLPRHPRCRCFYSPITRSWRELGIDVAEVPATTRASMTGQVPERQSWRGWLRKQSAATQRGIFGPTRYGLYKSGELKVDEFVNYGRIVPLKRLAPGALAVAGAK